MIVKSFYLSYSLLSFHTNSVLKYYCDYRNLMSSKIHPQRLLLIFYKEMLTCFNHCFLHRFLSVFHQLCPWLLDYGQWCLPLGVLSVLLSPRGSAGSVSPLWWGGFLRKELLRPQVQRPLIFCQGCIFQRIQTAQYNTLKLKTKATTIRSLCSAENMCFLFPSPLKQVSRYYWGKSFKVIEEHMLTFKANEYQGKAVTIWSWSWDRLTGQRL